MMNFVCARRLMILFLLLFNGIVGDRATIADEPQVYSVEEENRTLKSGQIVVTKIYSRLDQRVLVKTSRLDGKVKKVQGWNFGIRSRGSVAAQVVNTDTPVRQSGTYVDMECGISTFGWFGKKNKDMLEVFFVPEINNLLTKNDQSSYRLLDAKEIKKLDARGPVVVLEELLGLPLAHKKGVPYGGKPHLRDKQLRCFENWLDVIGDDGKLQKEKRYTFYGKFGGVHCEIFRWSLNSTTKLSWIDSEAGMGSFMFFDKDSDGQYETLECEVNDDEQPVEIFDVSDPWNIKLGDDQIVIDRNVRVHNDKKAIENLGKRKKNGDGSN